MEIIKLYLRSQFALAISKEYNIKGRYEYNGNALKTYLLFGILAKMIITLF